MKYFVSDYLDIDRLQLDCRDKLAENTIPYRSNHHFPGSEIHISM